MMKVGGQVTLTGAYADVRQFLYEVETAEEFVIIEEVSLSQSSVAQGATLELTLKIATYFLGDGSRVAR
jgi:Tfp pilus assembly protein PilO